MEQTLWMAVITAMLSTAAVADYLTNYQAAVLAAAPLLPPPLGSSSLFPPICRPPSNYERQQGSWLHLEKSRLYDKAMLLLHSIRSCCICSMQAHAAIALYNSQAVNLTAQSLYILSRFPTTQCQ